MGVGTIVLLEIGVAALVGAVIGRWWVLPVLLLLWLGLEVTWDLTGGLHSNEDTPEMLVTLSFLLILLPAEVGALGGIAARKLHRLRRGKSI